MRNKIKGMHFNLKKGKLNQKVEADKGLIQEPGRQGIGYGRHISSFSKPIRFVAQTKAVLFLSSRIALCVCVCVGGGGGGIDTAYLYGEDIPYHKIALSINPFLFLASN